MTQDGFSYAFDYSHCDGCGGRCCTGESGNIFVNRAEVQAIATFLKMDELAFAKAYLVKKGYKYSLKEQIVGVSHDCIFYSRDIGGCLVYEARPTQCRTFPFWDYFKSNITELKDECPGIIDV
jgi:hypothetical protein